MADEPLGDARTATATTASSCTCATPTTPDEELDAKVDGARDGRPPDRDARASHGADDLGRIFFFAEFATAVAGWVLGINPFDQPNVQEAKDNTAQVLEPSGELPEVDDADDALRELLDGVGAAALRRDHGLRAARPTSSTRPSSELRARDPRRARSATTTFGYGPRFLHSTGQFHKGGPPTGRFLQLVHDGDEDVEIPGGRLQLRAR